MTANPETNPAGLYFPLTSGTASSVFLAVHVRQDPQSFVPRLRTLAAAIDPALRINRLRRLDEIRNDQTRWHMIWARILTGTSLVVLSLSLAGIYSILSFTVSRRTREIGIRIALGADRRRIVAAIFARPLLQVSVGVLTGVGLLGGGIRSVVVALIVLAFTALMMGVCMLALSRSQRALRIEPIEALKAEA